MAILIERRADADKVSAHKRPAVFRVVPIVQAFDSSMLFSGAPRGGGAVSSGRPDDTPPYDSGLNITRQYNSRRLSSF